MSKWEWKKLGEVAEIVGGSTPKTGVEEYWNGKNIWITPAEIGRDLFLNDSVRHISDAAVKSANLKLMPAGTVILSSRAPIGKLAISNVPFYCNQGFKNAICGDLLNNKFLFFYLLSSTAELESLGKGTTFKEISKTIVENFPVPVPPLSEQKRIVKFLDNEFSKIDTLKTNAETNLKNAKELFETTLEKETCSRMGWEIACAGDLFQLTDYVSNGSFASLKENVKYFNEEEYAVLIRLVDFSNNFDSNKFVYVNKHAYDFLSKSRLMGGELIMCNIGATIGKCFICPKLNKPMTLGPNCISVTTPNNRYFAYYFLSKNFKKILWKIINKTTLEKFNKTQFKTLQIPLPPLSVQKEIVARLDKLSENVKRLEANYKQIIADCDELKKSILKKTFEGDSRSSRE